MVSVAIFLLLSTVVCGSVGAIAEGLVLRALWHLAYGPGRSELATRLLLFSFGLPALATTLVWCSLMASSDNAGLGLAAALVGGLVRMVVVLVALAPSQKDHPVVPRHARVDHDALHWTVRSRTTGPALAAVGVVGIVGWWALLPLVALAALLEPLRRAETRITLRSQQLDVEWAGARSSIDLAGLEVTRDTDPLGTDVLVLEGPEGRIEVPTGGTPPGEVAWLAQQIAEQAATAEPQPKEAPVPDALRRMVQQAPDRS